MTAHTPPVPPAGRSPKGPGEGPKAKPGTSAAETPGTNTDEAGDAGNVHQNTTNTGHQQDR